MATQSNSSSVTSRLLWVTRVCGWYIRWTWGVMERHGLKVCVMFSQLTWVNWGLPTSIIVGGAGRSGTSSWLTQNVTKSQVSVDDLHHDHSSGVTVEGPQPGDAWNSTNAETQLCSASSRSFSIFHGQEFVFRPIHDQLCSDFRAWLHLESEMQRNVALILGHMLTRSS